MQSNILFILTKSPKCEDIQFATITDKKRNSLTSFQQINDFRELTIIINNINNQVLKNILNLS